MVSLGFDLFNVLMAMDNHNTFVDFTPINQHISKLRSGNIY